MKTEQTKETSYKEAIVKLICLLLVLMWTYVVLSKWSDGDLFRAQLVRQPVLKTWVPLLFYLLPGTELLVACLIANPASRLYGLWTSFFLMVFFTGYVGLALSDRLWEHRPCACGGILSSLGWRAHLWFNLVVSGFNALALCLNLQIRTQQRKESGENSSSGLAGQKATR